MGFVRMPFAVKRGKAHFGRRMGSDGFNFSKFIHSCMHLRNIY